MGESSVSKGFGLGFGCCLFVILLIGLAIALPVFGVMGLITVGSLANQLNAQASPQTNSAPAANDFQDTSSAADSVSIAGTTGRIHVIVNSLMNPKMAGYEIAPTVYQVATKHPELKEIDVEVEIKVAGGGITDGYGHLQAGPYIMGVIPVTNLDEVRKYADDTTFSYKYSEIYGEMLLPLKYGQFLRQ